MDKTHSRRAACDGDGAPESVALESAKKRRRWLPIALALLGAALLAAAWKWTGLRGWTDPQRLAELGEPLRSSWFALPIVVLVFVLAELVLFPVLALVFVCGLAFGPWLGALYALAGSVASAIPPFFLGRKLGQARLEKLGGRTARAVARALEKRGVMAVFFVRKIPAPFTLVNLACGATRVSLHDFLIGTLLGMGTGVIVITILGGRLLDLVRDPQPGPIALAVLLMFVPLLVAWLVQRLVNRRVEARG